MGMNVYEISASITLDTSEYEQSLEKSRQQTSAFGDVLKANLVSDTVISGAKKLASAVLDIGKSAYSSYGEYEQLVGGSQLMFGDAYDIVAENAKNAYKTVQMSQNDYLRQANGFAVGLKTAMGGNAKAAAELADKIITAEADVIAATGNSQEAVQNAFNGIMRNNYMMLDNLQLGIVPTKEGFQSLIDKVNDWNAENGRMTSYTLDNLADCQQALVDYIDMQGISGQASREASGTVEGSTAAMKAAWKNLVTGLGDSNSDIKQLTLNFIDTLNDVRENSETVVESFLGNVATMVTTAYGELKDSSQPMNIGLTILEDVAVGAAAITSINLLVAAVGKLKTALASFKTAGLSPVAVSISAFAILLKHAKEASDDFVASLYPLTDGSLKDSISKLNAVLDEISMIQSGDWNGPYDNERSNMQYLAALVEREKQIRDYIRQTYGFEAEEAVSSGELSGKAVEQAEQLINASQSFAQSAEEILTSYWDTYNSIYAGLFKASSLFTTALEATKYDYKDEKTNKEYTGADVIRMNIAKSTSFYNQYAADLEFIQKTADDAGVSIDALNEILNAMSAEDAAGALAALRSEIEGVGQSGSRERYDAIHKWAEMIQDYADSVARVSKPLTKSVTDVKNQTDKLLEEYSQSIEGLDKSSEAEAAARATMEALAFGIEQNTGGVLGNLDTLTSEMKKRLTASFDGFVLSIDAIVDVPGINGSHKSGLGYVPFDGYIAQLHQGERVLTAQEAAEYRSGMKPAASQPISLTAVVELDGEQIGRAAYKYQFSEDRRSNI